MTFVAALLVVAAAAPSPPAKTSATAIAQRVQRHYERIKDFTATFAQTSTYPTFGNVTKAAGKVFVKKPDLLRWARDRAGMDVDELRQKFPKIDEWEAEHIQPTLKQLEAYARATRTPTT